MCIASSMGTLSPSPSRYDSGYRNTISSSSEMEPSPLRSRRSKTRRTMERQFLSFCTSCQSNRLVTNSSISTVPSPLTSILDISCCISSCDRLYPLSTSAHIISLADTSPDRSVSATWNSSRRSDRMVCCSGEILAPSDSMSLAIMVSTCCFRWLCTANRCSRCTAVPSSGVSGAMPPSAGSRSQGCRSASVAVGRRRRFFCSSTCRNSCAGSDTPSFDRLEKSISSLQILPNNSFMVGDRKCMSGQYG
mmetsp:Transcript_11092/g.28005  ORF Transcript_11092/g.28005 Transcript_11092/m.28005 type:complete len:249 (+) Transcript_11092:256-1002(+)